MAILLVTTRFGLTTIPFPDPVPVGSDLVHPGLDAEVRR